MFSRAPRFREPKPSDIPGPGAYDPVDIDAIFTDRLKRGAFLEKADRFDPNKPSDTPGPNSYAPAQPQPGPSKPPPMSSAIMKQQLDALRARLEKEHQRTLQQLEARATRAEARSQELSKEHATLRSAASQAERELRMALQRESSLKSSLEKTEATLDQLRQRAENYANLQVKLVELEAQHADSKRQQKERIARLEREQEHERTEHSSKLQELAKRMGETSQEATRAREMSAEQNRILQSEVIDMKERLEKAQTSHDEIQLSASRSEERAQTMEELVQQITVAYSHLASTSRNGGAIPHENTKLKLSSMRLERKLADRDAQVTELTLLIRHVSEQNRLLFHELSCAQEHIASLRSLSDPPFDPGNGLGLVDLANLTLDAERLRMEDMATTVASLSKLHSLDTGISFRTEIALSQALDEFHHNAAMAGRYEKQADLILGHYENQVPQLTEKVSLLEASLVMKQEELEEREAVVRELRMRDAETHRRMMETEECLSQQVEETRKARSYQAHQVESLNEALARARMGETALEAQVTSLESSLSDAIKIQDDYQELVKRVDVLVSRNALAEDEAKYLSEFNAHLLGHSNLNQRIFYVDRLRKEMTELKQKLLTAEWERAVIAEKNAELVQELDVYRSVKGETKKASVIIASFADGGVSPDARVVKSPPRTILTRVERRPLGVKNINDGHWEGQEGPSSLENGQRVSKACIADGDALMTLGELSR